MMPVICPKPIVLLVLGPALFALALLAGSAAAADRQDPFDTAALRPAAPSQFWNGPATACAGLDKIPEPPRLGDAIDIALCNNPLTRLTWASAKVSAAQVGVAQSAYLPDLSATASLSRIENRNASASGGQTALNGALHQLPAVRLRRARC
jgi:outer membrane protein